MLSPRAQSAPMKRFGTYSIAWHPGTYRVRLASFFDGQRFYRYEHVEDLLAEMLSPRRSGSHYFAHCGGLADIQFIIPFLRKMPKVKAYAIFAGASAIVLDVRSAKNRWLFCDSYWLFREPLEDVIKDFTGETVKDLDTASMNYSDLSQWVADRCRGLCYSIGKFQAAIRKLGGSVRSTAASTSMALFLEGGYLSKPLRTHQPTNRIARLGYHGSRVENIWRSCGAANLYDMNAAHASEMASRTLPGEVDRSDRDLPKTHTGDPFLACVRLKSDGEFPAIAYKTHGRTFFPNGTFDAWISNADLEALSIDVAGGSRGTKIEEVYEVIHFKPFDDLKRYADKLWKIKEQGGILGRVASSMYKSFYGKWAQRPETFRVLFGHFDGKCPHKDPSHVDEETNMLSCVVQIQPGVFKISEYKPAAHEWVPIAQGIASGTMCRELKLISKCVRRGGKVFNFDTDNVFTTAELETSRNLGEIKLVDRVRRGIFAAPKTYLYENAHGEVITRAAGMPELNEAEFMQYIAGDGFDYLRMARLPEQFAQGVIEPHDVHQHRKQNKNDLEKRRFLPTGGSVPWDRSEIDGYYSSKKLTVSL